MFARPGLPSFDYLRAATASQVVELLQEHGAEARLLMGGTDLFPGLREGRLRPRLVVDVKGVPGLREVRYAPEDGLTVGAAVTMNELVRHPDVRAHYPLLALAAGSVASYQIRNRATIGGNVCNASPCADTSPAALVLEASLNLHGPGGERRVPAGEFFLGPGRTVLQAGEFLTAIHFPPPHPGAVARYRKLGRCRSGDLSLVAVALLAYADGTPSGYEFRLGLGSVAPTPIRAREAEAHLASQPAGEESLVRAAELACAASSPITDVRATAAYQRDMVRNLALRELRAAWQALQE
ncbi:MAG: xanthine dehydrogenase family protein subunit M [Anaerolineaceae bacterium]|nr:xanthine dehydrogenase family protein subunit M [Anaerolineaceae bacterium]